MSDTEDEIEVIEALLDGKRVFFDENTNAIYDPDTSELIGEAKEVEQGGGETIVYLKNQTTEETDAEGVETDEESDPDDAEDEMEVDLTIEYDGLDYHYNADDDRIFRETAGIFEEIDINNEDGLILRSMFINELLKRGLGVDEELQEALDNQLQSKIERGQITKLVDEIDETEESFTELIGNKQIHFGVDKQGNITIKEETQGGITEMETSDPRYDRYRAIFSLDDPDMGSFIYKEQVAEIEKALNEGITSSKLEDFGGYDLYAEQRQAEDTDTDTDEESIVEETDTEDEEVETELQTSYKIPTAPIVSYNPELKPKFDETTATYLIDMAEIVADVNETQDERYEYSKNLAKSFRTIKAVRNPFVYKNLLGQGYKLELGLAGKKSAKSDTKISMYLIRPDGSGLVWTLVKTFKTNFEKKTGVIKPDELSKLIGIANIKRRFPEIIIS